MSWPPTTWTCQVDMANLIGKMAEEFRAKTSKKSNHILQVAIFTPGFNVNPESLKRLCSATADLIRCVVLKKRSPEKVAAMLEFASVEDAERVKMRLDGTRLDDGSKIAAEFAFERVFKLKIARNCDDQWDFTTQHTEVVQGVSETRNNKRPLMSLLDVPTMPLPPSKKFRASEEDPTLSTAVVMIYDLNMERISAERVFNVLCVYGDVLKIKFLVSKPGCAMVQMADAVAADRVIRFVSGIPLFRNRIAIRKSKQVCLRSPFRAEGKLTNGADSFKEFGRELHRFGNNNHVDKNRIVEPNDVLHFYNAPHDFNIEAFEGRISGMFCPRPRDVVVFPRKSMQSKTSSGVIVFETLGEAVDALAVANHMNMDGLTLKLCFSDNFGSSKQR